MAELEIDEELAIPEPSSAESAVISPPTDGSTRDLSDKRSGNRKLEFPASDYATIRRWQGEKRLTSKCTLTGRPKVERKVGGDGRRLLQSRGSSYGKNESFTQKDDPQINPGAPETWASRRA